jgi:hypothetical protein
LEHQSEYDWTKSPTPAASNLPAIFALLIFATIGCVKDRKSNNQINHMAVTGHWDYAILNGEVLLLVHGDDVASSVSGNAILHGFSKSSGGFPPIV